MPRRRRLAPRIAVAALALGCLPLVAGAGTGEAAAARGAPPATQFACKQKNADTCVVRIPLRSGMREQVGARMPDKARPWSLHHAGGAVAEYTLSAPGAKSTYWNGKSGAAQGTNWSARLTTRSVHAGAVASLTFTHVAARAVHYTSFSASYPSTVPTGAIVEVTAVVHPVPPAGHLYVQRENGSTWVNVARCTRGATTKTWTGRFKWTYPARTTRVFRLYATASKGLLSTPGGTFRIATSG